MSYQQCNSGFTEISNRGVDGISGMYVSVSKRKYIDGKSNPSIKFTVQLEQVIFVNFPRLFIESVSMNLINFKFKFMLTYISF